MDPRLLAYNPQTELLEDSGVDPIGTRVFRNTKLSLLSGPAELESAVELLEVANEQELDQFLGDLLRRASKAGGKAMGSSTAQALVPVLKRVAIEVMPNIARTANGQGAPSRESRFGQQLARSAEATFGLELEGLSREDQEFETAKAFVRFAGDALMNAVTPSSSIKSGAIAGDAFLHAAKFDAPGLTRSRG